MPSPTPPSTLPADTNPLHIDLDAAQGQAIHRAIGLLLGARSQWAPSPALSDIVEAAAAGCGHHPIGTTNERAFRQNVTTSVGVYARRFLLGPDWAFAGAEVAAPASRFDLVWRHEDGRVLIDEIKRGANRHNHAAAIEQVRRYTSTAKDLFGPRFLGVRLLWVSAPLSSQFYAARRIRGVALSSVSELIGTAW